MKRNFIILDSLKIETTLKESNNINVFKEFQEAEKEMYIRLERKDKSSGLSIKKEKIIHNIKLEETKSKLYNYNVLRFQNDLEGNIINLAVVIWNKETKEIEYKFINKEILNKVIELMPGFESSKKIIQIEKKRLKKYKVLNDFDALRKHLFFYSKSYPLTHNYIFELGHLYRGHNDNIEIKKVLKRIYNSYIGNNYKY